MTFSMSSMQQVNKAWSRIVGKSVSWNGLEMMKIYHRSYPRLVAKMVVQIFLSSFRSILSLVQCSLSQIDSSPLQIQK